MNKKQFITLLAGGRKDIQDTPFLLTITTTGAATVQINQMNVATGKTVTVDWGDGSSNTYSGSPSVSHAYAGAGTWSVKLSNRRDIVTLSLEKTQISCTINKANPLPVNLTALYLLYPSQTTWVVSADAPIPSSLQALNLYVQSGVSYNANNFPLPASLQSLTVATSPVTYNINTNPLPAGLTTLYLYRGTGTTSLNITWDIGADPLPAALTYLYFQNLPSISWAASVSSPIPAGLTDMFLYEVTGIDIPAARWAVNTLQHIDLRCGMSQARVDAVVSGIWANKANFTHATPSLGIVNGYRMASPSGIYQLGSGGSGLPVTGKEYVYDLVNGAYTSAGPEWSIPNFSVNNLSVIGDSIFDIGATHTIWPGIITAYAGGIYLLHDRAISGQSIMANMDAQTAFVAGDGSQIIVLGLGTNDANDGDMTALQAEVEENLLEIKTANPTANIFYMNVLPRWTSAAGTTVNDKANIRVAIAAACTAQSVTCWDSFTTPWITAADTVDGTHPNTSGKTKIQNEILARLP